MLARLGNVIYWACCALAALCLVGSAILGVWFETERDERKAIFRDIPHAAEPAQPQDRFGGIIVHVKPWEIDWGKGGPPPAPGTVFTQEEIDAEAARRGVVKRECASEERWERFAHRELSPRADDVFAELVRRRAILPPETCLSLAPSAAAPAPSSAAPAAEPAPDYGFRKIEGEPQPWWHALHPAIWLLLVFVGVPVGGVVWLIGRAARYILAGPGADRHGSV